MSAPTGDLWWRAPAYAAHLQRGVFVPDSCPDCLAMRDDEGEEG
jgi:hypothetical protein